MNCPSLLKHPGGRTATGTKPKEGRTVACGPSYRGKKIHIDGIGTRVCEDRGGAISDDHIDLYVDHVAKAHQWGRKQIAFNVL